MPSPPSAFFDRSGLLADRKVRRFSRSACSGADCDQVALTLGAINSTGVALTGEQASSGISRLSRCVDTDAPLLAVWCALVLTPSFLSNVLSWHRARAGWASTSPLSTRPTSSSPASSTRSQRRSGPMAPSTSAVSPSATRCAPSRSPPHRRGSAETDADSTCSRAALRQPSAPPSPAQTVSPLRLRPQPTEQALICALRSIQPQSWP